MMRSRRTTEEIAPLLPKIRTLLERVYGERLVDVVLFGSVARNNAREDSDIDIAVILKGKVNKAQEIGKIGEVLYDLMLETDELVSVYPLAEDEMSESTWPLYAHIKREGIKI